ncbi:glycine--lipid A transferase AlmG [Vibrio cholerae]|nr:glycine--lipid A transferase AlmG [Vibrio cholerae]
MRIFWLKALTTGLFYLPLSIKNGLCHLVAKPISRKKMAAALTQLNYALPDLSDVKKQAIVEQSTRLSLKNLLGFCHLKRYQYQVEQPDLVQEILDNQGGGIIVCPHMGVYDGVTWWLNQQGKKAVTIFGAGSSGDRPDENAMISQAAKLAGVPYLLRKQNLMLELAQRIKQGEWVVLHTDMRTEGVPVRWFGQATQLSATPFFLAHKLACPIYFHYALSEGMTQRLHFSRFALHQTDDLGRNIAQDAQQLADMMQQAISAHPEQWIWLYRRFK